MTTGEKLAELSKLSGVSALTHLLAINTSSSGDCMSQGLSLVLENTNNIDLNLRSSDTPLNFVLESYNIQFILIEDICYFEV